MGQVKSAYVSIGRPWSVGRGIDLFLPGNRTSVFVPPEEVEDYRTCQQPNVNLLPLDLEKIHNLKFYMLLGRIGQYIVFPADDTLVYFRRGQVVSLGEVVDEVIDAMEVYGATLGGISGNPVGLGGPIQRNVPITSSLQVVCMDHMRHPPPLPWPLVNDDLYLSAHTIYKEYGTVKLPDITAVGLPRGAPGGRMAICDYYGVSRVAAAQESKDMIERLYPGAIPWAKREVAPLVDEWTFR